MINRSAIVLRHAQPFIDWVAALPGAEVLPSLDDEPTVYLVPPFDDPASALEVLESAYALLFEGELYDWDTDEASWPADRDLEMFRAWFRVELLPVLTDICQGEIVEENATEE